MARGLQRGRSDPSVTVVLTITEAHRDYLNEAFDSLAAQTHARYRVLVAPYGSCAGVMDDVKGRVRADLRIRLLPGVSRSRGAACNAAARRVNDPFLVFMDGCDLLPTYALKRLVDTLIASGSDFALGRLEHAPTVGRTVTATVEPAHRRDRIGVDIESFPVAITDTYENNRMYRTEFWRRASLRFPEEPSLERSPAVDALFRSAAFDVLETVTYVHMSRSGGPFGQQHNSYEEFDNWLAGQRAMLGRLSELGPVAGARMRDAYLAGTLEMVSQTFVEDVERATADQWSTLVEQVRSSRESISPERWKGLSAESRVRLHLLAEDRRHDLTKFVAQRWFEAGNRPTHVEHGRVYACLPFFREEQIGVPDDYFEMNEVETALRVVLQRVRWLDDERLELDLLAYIAFVDMTADPRVEVALIESGSGSRTPLQCVGFHDSAFTPFVGHRYQNYDRGGVRVVVDAGLLMRRAAETDAAAPRWNFEFTMRSRGVTRSTTRVESDRRGSGGMLGSPHLAPRGSGAYRVTIAPDLVHGVQLRAIATPPVRLLEATVSERTLSGRLVAAEPVRNLTITLRGRSRLRVKPSGRRGDLSFTVELPTLEGEEAGAFWTVRALMADGRTMPVAFPDNRPDPWIGVGEEVCLARTPQGNCELLETASTVVLEQIDSGEDSIRVRGHWLGAPEPGASLQIRGKEAHRAASVPEEGRFDLAIPTRWDPWKLGSTLIPTGKYDFVLHGRAGRGVTLLGRELFHGLVDSSVGHEYRIRPLRRPGVSLSAPLTDQERGPYGQRRMQQAHIETDAAIDEGAVYFQSYTGQSATDSPLAIHRELRRRRPDLKLYWGVRDRSSVVPEGGVPLLMQSRAWYEVLSTAKYLVTNIDFDRWFAPRPGQRFLQTFHGYPSKSMGIRMWRAKNLTPLRIEAELARTSMQWSLILTPAPEMDRYYREEYAYEGPIHHHGYPRDDVLVSPEAHRTRKETRHRLGIGEDQIVVLYAPTWRDDMATSWRAAPLVDHLDVQATSEALGDGFVLLMRGHRFHARGDGRTEQTARLIDVTDYPEINDLILAADAAVLDYSSLRFDFSLTGRPMIFLVPDLKLYEGGVRGFLYDYRDTAPGPLVADTAEVVAALRDLPKVRAEYAEAYRRFNAKFNYLMDGDSTRRVVNTFFI